jgi:hypothetical protein
LRFVSRSRRMSRRPIKIATRISAPLHQPGRSSFHAGFEVGSVVKGHGERRNRKSNTRAMRTLILDSVISDLPFRRCGGL